MYQKLSFESLEVLRWYIKLFFFYKVLNNEHPHPHYLFHLIHIKRMLSSDMNH